MDTNTILKMEAGLLQNRIKTWYYTSVGREIALYNNQEDTIHHAMRFTNSLTVSLDLSGELVNCQTTVKFLLANTLRMIERRAKLVGENNNDPNAFIPYMRKKFTASLNLFRFLISPSYVNAASKEAKATLYEQVGGDSLFVWGESLLCFAECSLKYWKPQYILVLKAAEDRITRCLQFNAQMHQAHYTMGNILLLEAKTEVMLSPPFLNLVHRAKDEFFEASQILHGVKAYNFSFIRSCALLGQEQELSQLLPSFVSTFPDNAAILLAENDFDHYRSQKWFHVLIERASNPQLSKLPYQPLPPQPSQARPLPPPHTQPPQLSHAPPVQQLQQSPQKQPQLQSPQKQPLPQQPQQPKTLQQTQTQPQSPQQQQQQKQQQQQAQQQLPPHLDPSHPLHNIADYQLMNSYPPPMLAYPEVPYMIYPDPYAYQPMSTIPPPSVVQQQQQQLQQIQQQNKNNGNKRAPHSPSYSPSSHMKTGIEEKQYGALQTSLIESGFSIKRLLEVFSWLPVSSGILQAQPEEESEHVKKQKQRLQQRLELYQLKPKREIPGDGNCQMHAVSDQLYDTIDRSKEVRKTVVDWLRKNKNWKLPNNSVLHEFVHDKPWEEYCNLMEKDGCWGDHLTLLAISEIFGAVISIMSSVEGDNFITEIHPTVKKTSKVILLSHYAEFHYGSLTHIGETLK